MEWSLTQDKLLAYHRLMRTDKPIGALLLLWPTLWALWVATPGLPPLWILAVFVAGVWLMRAAGCVVNDYADRKFDGHVKRTANRPLPSGQVTEKEARTLFVVLIELTVPSSAGGAGRGVWLVDPDGVCGGERIRTAQLLAYVPGQYTLGRGVRYAICDGRP